METLNITQEQFLEMVQSRIGYCRACGTLQVDEIDANIYNTACPECGEMQVCGVEPLRQLGDIVTTPKMIYNGPDILDENGDKIVPVDPSLVGGGMGPELKSMQEIMEMLSSMQTDPIEDDGNNNNNNESDSDSEEIVEEVDEEEEKSESLDRDNVSEQF